MTRLHTAAAALLLATGLSAQTGIDTLGTLLVVSNDGSDVWNQTGSSILLVNNQTGASTTIRTGGSLYCPVFSPDGRSICYFSGTSIYIANNDGTGVQKICDSYNNRSGRPTWCTDGNIWWSEFTNEIYRVPVATKVREKYWTNCPAQGHDAVVVEALTVSADGTRGESNGNGKVNSLDLIGKTLVSQPGGGCAGAISSDGRWQIVQGTAPATPGSSGGFNGTWIKDFTTGATVTYVNVASGGQLYYHSGSKNNPDFFMARSLVSAANGSWLCKVSTQQSKIVMPASGAWIPSDFWCGPLPSASTTPVIALNKSLLSFTAAGSNPANQTVTVSNSGAGTLTAVITAKSSAWLTVTLSGSGNSQTLTNSISISGLADGSYRDTVTVSGGGASNSVKYAVNLTVGSIPAAPSGLTAVAHPGVYSSSVGLTWTDNAGNETSLIVERQVGTGSWAQRATVAANATAWTDTGLAAGQYSYRVSARNSYGTSAASNAADVTVGLQPQVILTAPLPTTQLRQGDTVYFSWSALNMTSVVLEYSIDDGEDFTVMAGLVGQLEPTDARWNHFPWKVVAAPTGSVYIRVASYTQRSINDVQGPYTVTGTSTVARSATARRAAQRLNQGGLRSLANGQALATADASSVRILQLNGACVGQATQAGLRGQVGLAAGRYVGVVR